MGSATHRRTSVWVDLGPEDYVSAARLQERLLRLRRDGEIPDTFIALEHRPCVTIGRGGTWEHVLATADVLERHGITVHESDRGGDVTYHGPGQLVCYAIVDLKDYGSDLHAHVRRLEAVMMDTAASFGVVGWRRVGYPGVWTTSGKIGAVGVAVHEWVTKHGIALNVDPDLAHYSLITPCGLPGIKVTSFAAILGRPPHPSDVRRAMRRACERVFSCRLESQTRDEAVPMKLGALLSC